MLTSAGDRTERQERKVEEDVEREKRTKSGRTLTETPVGVPGASVMPWPVILVVTGELGTVLWVASNTTQAAVPLLAAVWGSMDAFGLFSALVQRAVVVRAGIPSHKGVSGLGRSRERWEWRRVRVEYPVESVPSSLCEPSRLLDSVASLSGAS